MSSCHSSFTDHQFISMYPVLKNEILYLWVILNYDTDLISLVYGVSDKNSVSL